MRAYLLQIMVALLSVVTLGRTSVAQVFIAEQGYRDALNAAVPGLVDGSGMMDIAHPGLATVDSLVLSFQATSPSVELNGLEHFSELQYLMIGTIFDPNGPSDGTINVPHCPPNLADLGVFGPASVTIDEQPAVLNSLWASPGLLNGALSLTMNNPPDEIGTLFYGENTDLQWNEMVNVGQLNLENGPFSYTVILPPMEVVNCFVWGNASTLDMSATTIGRLHFNLNSIWDQLIFPEEVTYLYYDVETLTPLQSWPSILDSLYIRGWNTCDPPFPASLRSLEYHYGPNCIPNWPPLLDSIIVGQPGLGNIFENTANYCSVLNSDCPGAYPALAGDVRMDLNNNGTVDSDEPIVPSSTVTIAPGGQSTGCASDGSWQIGVPPGEH
ncbi:MAG: hypothetical protein JNN32_13530, partial [Flavobacteriales bacterium]|nr:hypothetical protein [Flavobacteriales bacterium]